jgi:(E)-4-hydroxy-3-methylbut-2-enyl-diphosphate synthase
MTSRSRSSRTNVPNTIASSACVSENIDHPLHLSITEAGTKLVEEPEVAGSLPVHFGFGIGIRIGHTMLFSLSTFHAEEDQPLAFHAEEEVKVAWEILKALQSAPARPVLIA